MRFQRTGLWFHHDFLKLWAGQTISIFGTVIGGLALTFVAIIWLDASAFDVAVLSFCQIAPGFLAGPIAGVWVDRLHRRPIMIVSDIGRFAALVTIPIAALFGALAVEQLWLVAAVASALTTFFDVAYQSYLPSLVSKDELLEGNARLETSASVAEIGGFGIAGWLVQLITAPGAVLVDALSFLASALCVWRIKAPEPAKPPMHERRHMLREAEEGMRFLIGDAVLRALTIAAVIYAISSRLITVVLLLYLNRELGFGAGVLGTIFAVGGATSIAGAFLASRSRWFGGLGPALILAAFLRSVGCLALPLVWEANVWGVVILVSGQLFDSAWTFYNVNELSLRQSIADGRIQGRVHATTRFLEFGGMVIGIGIAGWMGAAIGFRETLFAAAGCQFLAAATLIFSPIARLRVAPAGGGPVVPETPDFGRAPAG